MGHSNQFRENLQEESFLDRVRRVLVEEGLLRFTVKLVKKLLSPLLEFGSVRLIEYQLDENLFAGKLPDGFVLRQGDPSDLDILIEAYDSSRSAALLEERFRKKYLCYLMIDSQGRGARCSWAIKEGSEYIPELDMDLVLGPGEAYMFDAHTRSDLRHGGIDLPARTFVIRTLAQAGLKRSYGYVGSDSCRAALRGAMRLGKTSGKVLYLRLRGCRTIVLGKRGLVRPTLVPAGLRSRRVQSAASVGKALANAESGCPGSIANTAAGHNSRSICGPSQSYSRSS